MSVILNNGHAQIIFRDADFQIPLVTPGGPQQRLIPNTAVIPSVQDISTIPERFLQCEVLLFREDQGSFAGADTLYSFFESADPDGVNGMANSFMLTDGDGDQFQVRFIDKLGGGLREMKKDTHFRGSFRLLVEPTLPLDMSTDFVVWYTAYDLNGNGGDFSTPWNWSSGEEVGNVLNPWLPAGNYEYTDGGGTSYKLSGSKRPNWYNGDHANAINNRPVVEFIAANEDRIGSNGVPLEHFNGTTDQPFTFIVVLDPDLDASTDVVFGMGSNGGATNDLLQLQHDGSNQFEVKGDDGSINRTDNHPTTPIDPAAIMAVTFDGTDIDFYRNGTDLAVGSTSLDDLGQLDVNFMYVGSQWQAGTDSNWFDGAIGEIIMWSRALTIGELRRQNQRLRDMWQIQLTG